MNKLVCCCHGYDFFLFNVVMHDHYDVDMFDVDMFDVDMLSVVKFGSLYLVKLSSNTSFFL